MAGRNIPTDESRIEVWNLSGTGTVWLYKYDRREDRWTKHRFGGQSGGGSGRVELTVDERKYNQGRVISEQRHEHDPFSNGRLVRVDGPDDSTIDTTYHWTTEHYQTLLDLRDSSVFQEEVRDIRSELILRRLAEVAATKGTVEQLNFVRDLLRERYPIGGSQRVVSEMLAEEERRGGVAF